MAGELGHRPKIVLVEDDESMRHAIERILRVDGNDVTAFESAEEMLNANVGGNATCLVLDIQLQGMSGFDLVEQLALHQVIKPVIFITAHDETSARTKARELGSIAFLVKPFASLELLAAVLHGRRIAERATKSPKH
jgi:FixJ family two-component response regulator